MNDNADVTSKASTEDGRTGAVGARPSGEDAKSIHDGQRRQVMRVLGLDRFSGLYVWAVLIIGFSIWSPDYFAKVQTAKIVINSNSIPAFAALGLIIPLATGVFDLSFAYTMTLSGVVEALLVANHHFSLLLAIICGVGAAMFVGVINGIVVVRLRIDSFIGTLATGTLVLAAVQWLTNDTPIVSAQFAGTFGRIASIQAFGISISVLYLLVLAVILWVVFDRTATGRRLYATGFNVDAAKLAGVRVDRLRFFALLSCSTIAGLAGIVLASSIQSGAPDSGTQYLLPVFAAVFLGATQIKPGRFNVWGTLIAVMMLATAAQGLSIVTTALWAPEVLTGVVLLAALSLTQVERQRRKGVSRKRPRQSQGASQQPS